MYDTQEIIKENDRIASGDFLIRTYLESGRKLSDEALKVEEQKAYASFIKMRQQEMSWLSTYTVIKGILWTTAFMGIAALLGANKFEDESYIALIALGVAAYFADSKHSKRWASQKEISQKRMQAIDLIKAERGDRVAQEFRYMRYDSSTGDFHA